MYTSLSIENEYKTLLSLKNTFYLKWSEKEVEKGTLENSQLAELLVGRLTSLEPTKVVVKGTSITFSTQLRSPYQPGTFSVDKSVTLNAVDRVLDEKTIQSYAFFLSSDLEGIITEMFTPVRALEERGEVPRQRLNPFIRYALENDREFTISIDPVHGLFVSAHVDLDDQDKFDVNSHPFQVGNRAICVMSWEFPKATGA